MMQFQELFGYLKNIDIPRLIWSGLTFIVVCLALLLIRGIVDSSRVKDHEKARVSRWLVYLAVLVYVLVLIPIWMSKDQVNLFGGLLNNPLARKAIQSSISFVPVWLGYFLVRRFINSLRLPLQTRKNYQRMAIYATVLVYSAILFTIWSNMQHWTTVFSIVGAGLALAMHEVLLNAAGWMYLSVRHPFHPGDRIEMGGVRGEVMEIRFFHTELAETGPDGIQPSGRTVSIPNGQSLRNPIYHLSMKWLWHELSITITPESDFNKAAGLLLEFGKELSLKHALGSKGNDNDSHDVFGKPELMTFVQTTTSGIKITLRFPAIPHERRRLEDEITRRFLDAVKSSKRIVIAVTPWPEK